MVELRDIHKHFDAVVALHGAGLTVAPGEIRALLGSNGSGKSTLIKILAGLVEPTGGQVLFDGAPVHIRNGRDARSLGIATTFQELSLIPMMSVRDNILLGNEPLARLGLVDRKSADRRIEELLDRFHIKCDPDTYVQALTPSVQTMVEVAKAVAQNPRLLLLDEVTAPLHYDEVELLFGSMRELAAEGVAMIYVTHRISEVFTICDTVTVVRNGETVAQGAVGDFSTDTIIYHMTGQRPEAAASHAGSETGGREGEPMLDVRNLELLPKAKDLSLKAYKGEIVGIGGLEGQGQSEFMRALLGATPFQGGEIVYDGQPRRFRSPAAAVREGIGFISGDRNREAIFALRTVEENLLAGKVAKGRLFAYMSARSIRAFARDAVGKYAIKIGSLRHAANSLSGGNQQKLVVARWIAMSPKLLLLDDPTKGVDIHSRREIHQILRRCAQEGMTVVMSLSETEELLDNADRIYVFYEGHVNAVLSGAQKTPEALAAAMLGMSGPGAADAPSPSGPHSDSLSGRSISRSIPGAPSPSGPHSDGFPVASSPGFPGAADASAAMSPATGGGGGKGATP
ncbi:MAG: sugar ABC transporter ATP-binding protein [Lachnospiraceae bacterium]|jgi:ABC-type sugar transport system ATPase subunit|nr:sugar ABC transporter ATP-binding protein [Lachnospiraceae bacterium]